MGGICEWDLCILLEVDDTAVVDMALRIRSGLDKVAVVKFVYVVGTYRPQCTHKVSVFRY